MKNNFKHNLKQSLIILGASLATAFSIEIFLLPSHTLIGGVAGIASFLDLMLTELDPSKWYLSVGIWTFAINIPIIVYCFLQFRRRFAVKTTIYVALLSVELILLRIFGVGELFKSVMSNDPTNYDLVVYVLLGGGLYGLAVPMMLSVNASTAGSDIPGLIVEKHSKRGSSLAMRVMFAVNITIVAIACVVYYFIKNDSAAAVNMFIYSLAAMFIAEIVQENIFKGFSSAIELEITSDKPEEMAEALKEGLKHGVTSVKVTGGYTKQEKTLILCVISKSQLTKARRIINQVDPNAFAYVENVKEVLGKGFANKESELDDNAKG